MREQRRRWQKKQAARYFASERKERRRLRDRHDWAIWGVRILSVCDAAIRRIDRRIEQLDAETAIKIAERRLW